MKIAIVFPSRGLVYSKTADELLRNLQGFNYDIFFAHGLPIPDCFEKPLTEALAVGRCQECIKTGCGLCRSGNNTNICTWNASKKIAENRELSSKVNLEDPTLKAGVMPTSDNKSVSPEEYMAMNTLTKMDTSSYTNLTELEKEDTELSWKKNSDVNLKDGKASTILTEFETTIDPKILSYGSEESGLGSEHTNLSAHTANSHTCSNHEALNSPEDYSHFWFVEDDMILSDDTLSAMIIMDVPVATYDYPVSKKGQGAVFKNAEGQIIFTGTGCLLVKRGVFDELKKPYFRTDIRWGATNCGSFIRMRANYMPDASEGYGLHDVTFGMKLWQANIPISEVGVLGQRKLIELGKPGSNEGVHKIEEWTVVKPNVLLKKFRRMPPQPLGKLVPVNTPQGELLVHPDKAKKLIKAGIATKPIRASVSIDYNEIEI